MSQTLYPYVKGNKKVNSTFFQGCSASQKSFIPSVKIINLSNVLLSLSLSLYLPYSAAASLYLSEKINGENQMLFFLPQEQIFIFYWKHVYV